MCGLPRNKSLKYPEAAQAKLTSSLPDHRVHFLELFVPLVAGNQRMPDGTHLLDRLTSSQAGSLRLERGLFIELLAALLGPQLSPSSLLFLAQQGYDFSMRCLCAFCRGSLLRGCQLACLLQGNGLCQTRRNSPSRSTTQYVDCLTHNVTCQPFYLDYRFATGQTEASLPGGHLGQDNHRQSVVATALLWLTVFPTCASNVRSAEGILAHQEAVGRFCLRSAAEVPTIPPKLALASPRALRAPSLPCASTSVAL